MKVAGLILARGGSKGINRKNLQYVGTSTLVSRSILTSLKAGFETFVSSDDDEILSEAVLAGATTILRPAAESSDTATSESAISHALSQPELSKFDIVCFLQPTSPFINPMHLVKACDLIISGAADTVFAAKEDHAFVWEKLAEGWAPIGHDRKTRPRRQDLLPRVTETGGFYIFKKSGFLSTGSRFSGTALPFMVDPRFAIDIDDYSDLELAGVLEDFWNTSSSG